MSTVPPPARGSAAAPRSERFHLWRSRKDAAASRIIGIGGVSVIGAVVLIFFYLLWVVFPLFLPATLSPGEAHAVERWARTEPVYFSIEEQMEVGLRVASDGGAEFFAVADGSALQHSDLPLSGDERVVRAADAVELNGLVAVGTSTGRVLLFRHHYETQFSGGVETKKIKPVLDFPYGEDEILKTGSSDISELAVSDGEDETVVAVLSQDGTLSVNFAAKSENFLSGEVSLEPDLREKQLDYPATGVALAANHRWLYVSDARGEVHSYRLPGLESDQTVPVSSRPITTLTMLLGGISLLAGDADGVIAQLFPVRDADNSYRLVLVRRFDPLDGGIVRILPEQRRKGFLAFTDSAELGIFHSTADRLLRRDSLADSAPRALALSPRANGLLIEGGGEQLQLTNIHNPHPEVSFASLWEKVWYEGYPEPEYVWQSSSASNDFEPKFSLAPLLFGTIKAALYAMLFAIPLALLGAAYTAHFMAPELRKWVKPGIEIMAALPTVILGFLAGLWFAPWLEAHLLQFFLLLLAVPPALLAFAWAWHRWDNPLKTALPDGWEALLLLPALVGAAALTAWIAGPLESLLFNGDMSHWVGHELGISYDQRNALVVGCAMGFAVIPTIFSIAEDAIFGVPKSLSNGSLALGATPWQTMIRVVLPTASPGIFSALMIGLGRAVGETMIVLMATGNTPLMDWNLFEGMRTLAANIAVEMPESEVAGTHYRILFLSGLVLFLFTFVINTGAEIVRQRLRDRYSSL